MASLIAGMTALSIIIPWVIYFIVYFIARFVYGNNRKATKLSIDFTTFFLILSVHFAIIAISGNSFLWLICIILMVIASTVVLVQYKVREEVDLKRVMKGFWRSTFLFFSTAYFLLVMAGITRRIIDTFL